MHTAEGIQRVRADSLQPRPLQPPLADDVGQLRCRGGAVIDTVPPQLGRRVAAELCMDL